MINKKICMLGSLAVGKTAMVQQFVYSIFSDIYLSSIGVKISKKAMKINEEFLNLILWDMEGEDDYSAINSSYVKGSDGILFVADGTRGESLSVVLNIRNTVLDLLGPDIAHILIINKYDLSEKWEVTDKVIASMSKAGLTVMKTSAKTGLNVDLAFTKLAEIMVGK